MVELEELHVIVVSSSAFQLWPSSRKYFQLHPLRLSKAAICRLSSAIIQPNALHLFKGLTSMRMRIITDTCSGRRDSIKWHHVGVNRESEDDDEICRLQWICNQRIKRNKNIRIMKIYNASPEFSAFFFETVGNFWESFGKLEQIHLSDCPFHFEVSSSLATFLARRGQPLRRLELNRCHFSERGIEEFFRAFDDHPKCIPDVVSLKIFPSSSVESFLRHLCDTSSIDATYSSNHSIKISMPPLPMKFKDTCWSLDEILRLNENPNKTLVARQKIAIFHFNDKFKMEPFEGMPADASIRVIECIDATIAQKDNYGDSIVTIKDGSRLSILFQLVRDNPHVCRKSGGGSQESEVEEPTTPAAKRRKGL